MRLLAILVAIGALCQTANAQTADCKSISKPDARLACYDKAAAPAKSELRAAPAANADGGKYVDPVLAEDARMNARLKSICRGC
jgi:hypothetical protein